MLWKAGIGNRPSYDGVHVSVCVSAQKNLKNCWSEIDVSWLNIWRIWWWGLLSYFWIQKLSITWKLLLIFCCNAHMVLRVSVRGS